MSFWSELKRRNVVRVAIAYLAAVWLLVQVAAIVVPAFELPDWVMRAILVISAVGFLIALTLAWIYDLTPAGIRRTDDLPATTGTARVGRKLDFVIIGTLSLALVMVVLDQYVLERSPATLDTFLDEATLELVSDFPGSHSEPTLSPDGTLVAFVNGESGSRQIWVKNLAQGEPIQITHGQLDASSPAWSPRNDQILFQRRGQGPISSIYSVGPLGTPGPRMLVERGTEPSFGENGLRFVFAVGRQIWIADADGSRQRRLADVPESPGFADRSPALSPDGSLVAFVHGEAGPAGDIWIVPVEGGEARRLTDHASLARVAGSPAWTADGRYVLYSAGGFGAQHIWRVDVETGESAPLTSGTGGYDSPSMSGDGHTLVYSNRRSVWKLMRTSPPDGIHAEIYESRNPIVLPQVSPDGQTIVFFSQLVSGLHIFTIDVDGGNLRQLTFDEGGINTLPVWSDSGDAVYYYRGESLHRIRPEGGPTEELLPDFHWSSRNWLAIHGSRLAYHEFGIEPGVRRTVIHDLEKGQEAEFPQPRVLSFEWSKDGSEIVGRLPNLNLVICSVDDLGCEPILEGGRAIGGEHPRWSADESRIFFQRASLGRGLYRNLWVVDRDGQNLTQLFEYGPLDEGYAISIGHDDELIWNMTDTGTDEIWVAQRAQ